MISACCLYRKNIVVFKRWKICPDYVLLAQRHSLVLYCFARNTNILAVEFISSQLSGIHTFHYGHCHAIPSLTTGLVHALLCRQAVSLSYVVDFL